MTAALNNSTVKVNTITCFSRAYFTYHINFRTSYHLLIAAVVLSVVNSGSAVMAMVMNGRVIRLIWRNRTNCTPSNTLLAWLAISDFLTGSLTQPLFIASLLFRVFNWNSVFCYVAIGNFIIGAILCGVTYLILMTISVDRYLAVLLHLRYKELATNTRVHKIVVVWWIYCATSVSLPFFTPPKAYELCIVLTAIISSAIYVYAYQKVFKTARRLERTLPQAQTKHNLQKTNARRQKKYLRVFFRVFCVYLLSYIPHVAVLCAGLNLNLNGFLPVFLTIGYTVTATIIFLTSSINPFLYGYEIKQIRRAVSIKSNKVASNFQFSAVTAKEEH